MSYLEESLSDGEELRTVFRLHWTVNLRIAMWLVLAGGGFWAHAYLGVLFLCIAAGEWVQLHNIEQAVTNKRVIYKNGLVSRKSEEMNLGSIETVEIRQSVLGRLFGYGTVKVAGRGLSDVVFKHIHDPMEVKRSIEGITPTA